MSSSSRLAQFWRDPVFHFVAIGGLLFAVYAWRGNAAVGAQPTPANNGGISRDVTVTKEQLREMMAEFQQQHGRLPSDGELTEQADAWVRGEVLYREGLAVGMERNDPVVRGRVIQLMQWNLAGSAIAGEPSEEALRRHFEANRARYSGPDVLVLEQIFFSSARRGETAETDAKIAAMTMKSGRQSATEMALGHGDSISGEVTTEITQRANREDLAARFGRPFVDTVAALPVNEWAGPFRSTLGWHVVRRLPKTEPSFDELRQLVRCEVLTGRGPSTPDEAYRELLKRYSVKMEDYPREVQK